MGKFFQILNKHISENNFYDVLDFLKENQINYLNYIKNSKIPLKYKNNFIGGNF